MVEKSKSKIIKSETKKRKSLVHQIEIHIEKILSNKGKLEVIGYWENEIMGKFIPQIALIDAKLARLNSKANPPIDSLELKLNSALKNLDS